MSKPLTMLATLAVALMWFAPLTRAVAQTSDPSAVFESVFSDREFELSADPNRPEWVNAPRIVAGKSYDGSPVQGAPMEVRSRWTREGSRIGLRS